MEEKDKKEMMGIVCEGIDKVSMPILGKILETQDEMKKDIKESKQDIKGMKIDMVKVKETQSAVILRFVPGEVNF